MRLFTAIDLPHEVTASLERLIAQLRPAAKIKWSPAGNLHITTKFIGEWPEQRLPEMIGALEQIAPRPPIEISVNGLGWFPNPHAPRVLWAALHAPDSLKDLARAVDAALAPLGVPKESREFSPHLTLARIKEPVPLASLRQAVAGLPSTDFGAFTADRFHLYLSKLARGGSVYTKLADFSFER